MARAAASSPVESSGTAGPDQAGTGPDRVGPGLGSAEEGLTVLLEACDRAIEDIGPAVSPVQLRALLVVGRAGGLNLNRLARALDSSASATSRLIDRMQAAGLLTRARAVGSRREIVLLPTESGRRLTDWVRSQHRAALTQVLDSMSQDGRQALARGLAELAAAVQLPQKPRRNRAVTTS
jgi:DNA-binding MarR family transcriptional regulator